MITKKGTSQDYAAVILGAGMGTRMKSRTPKALHRICGREMLLLVIDSVRAAGVDDITVVVPRNGQPFREALGDSVRYATQPEPLGTAHALLQARTAAECPDNILVLYGDTPLIRGDTLSDLMQRHHQSEACVSVVTAIAAKPDGMGRIIREDKGRDETGSITAIVEELNADDETLAIREVNSGLYCFRGSWLWRSLESLAPASNGELLLTDLIQAAVEQGLSVESITSDDPHETMGVNDRLQLAKAETILRQRIREQWMLGGVTMPDPASVYIDKTVTLEPDTVILPNTHITGKSVIGGGCKIGPNTIIDNAHIGDDCEIVSSVVRDSTLESGVDVGPFSHIRGGSHIEAGVHVGTSAEVKNSRLGRGTKMGHFSYMGDATLGTNVNIGAGAITCNFDGESKHETIIGKDAFIGSDTMLVAPVKIGDRASTGAGAVVTKDVPANSTVIGVPARVRQTENTNDAPNSRE